MLINCMLLSQAFTYILDNSYHTSFTNLNFMILKLDASYIDKTRILKWLKAWK